jgi:hypothetical protein
MLPRRWRGEARAAEEMLPAEKSHIETSSTNRISQYTLIKFEDISVLFSDRSEA